MTNCSQQNVKDIHITDTPYEVSRNWIALESQLRAPPCSHCCHPRSRHPTSFRRPMTSSWPSWTRNPGRGRHRSALAISIRSHNSASAGFNDGAGQQAAHRFLEFMSASYTLSQSLHDAKPKAEVGSSTLVRGHTANADRTYWETILQFWRLKTSSLGICPCNAEPANFVLQSGTIKSQPFGELTSCASDSVQLQSTPPRPKLLPLRVGTVVALN